MNVNIDAVPLLCKEVFRKFLLPISTGFIEFGFTLGEHKDTGKCITEDGHIPSSTLLANAFVVQTRAAYKHADILCYTGTKGSLGVEEENTGHESPALGLSKKYNVGSPSSALLFIARFV